jgi:hypothetical protein
MRLGEGWKTLPAWTVMLRGIGYRAGRSLVVFAPALMATTAPWSSTRGP